MQDRTDQLRAAAPEHDGRRRIILPGQAEAPAMSDDPPGIAIAPYQGCVIIRFDRATSGFVLSWEDAHNLALMLKTKATEALQQSRFPRKDDPDEPAEPGQASAPAEDASEGAGDVDR